MSTLTYPGVYIEEIPSGVHTITGVATSIAAFVGWAPQGPVNAATLVQSWAGYAAVFGGLDARSQLGYCVSQFFLNGGTQCYIVRLVWDGTLPAASGAPAPCATAFSNSIGYPEATVTATIGNVSGAITLGIGAPPLTAIAVEPNLPAGYTPPLTVLPPPMPTGATMTLSALPTYADNSQQPALGGVKWTSLPAGMVSIAGNVVTAMNSGNGTVTATDASGVVSGTLAIQVVNTLFSKLAINAPGGSLKVAPGETLALSATGEYGGVTQDLTAQVGWGPPQCFLSPQSPGLFTAPINAVQGTTVQVNAVLPWSAPGGTAPASATITIAPPAVLSPAIYPQNATTVPSGPAIQFAVYGYESSKPTELVALPQADWPITSSDGTVASVATATGVVTPGNAGSATLTATSTANPLVTLTTTLTVSAAPKLSGISVSPASVSVPQNETQQMTATGLYSDGSTADLTNIVTWSVTPAGTAGITVTGLLTGSSPGTAVVTAKWPTVPDSAGIPVTVTLRELESIAVTTPAVPPWLKPGQPVQLTATPTYSDGPGASVSTSATWSVSPPQFAQALGGNVVANAAGAPLTLFAANPGVWGNTLMVGVTLQPNNSNFNLIVQRSASNGRVTTLESFLNLSVVPTDPRYVVNVIDNTSNYITFVSPVSGAIVAPTGTPAATPPVPLGGGADGAVLTPATDANFENVLLNTPSGGIGLLDTVDIFNLLCVPGETDTATISQLQAYCNKKRALYIVDAPPLATESALQAQGPLGTAPGGTLQGGITGTYASNSAYYFPWVSAPDPLSPGNSKLSPPCGFVAGIYAATDATRGVWKAPAGISAGLTGQSGLQYVLTDDQNGSLNPQAINCLRLFRVYGEVVWGARTLAGNDQAGSEWKYVPVRRLALFLESSLYEGTQWVIFEPNDEKLWGQIRLNIGSFMQWLFLQGAFAGTTPQEAYFVKCDEDINTDANIALGIVTVQVGFAPLNPAEFLVIEIQQINNQSS
ncbi:Ig-like domain-containing protein [Paraburkholderia acidiphila]|uniref:BIG2 domain-containing protein n=1 Tax=Paraburkholderia acidiphila TaxID=2571747 RepID=A0A7Z2GDE3_9BURK|nr:Ig-like domain-containing protein [Paraburkholderia acidiphila]QGZ59470.1 hypothetical protein FAZ97_31235 [Paraburkholderia acidiphila]